VDAKSLRGAVVIAGIGHTTFGAHEGRSTVSLNVEAIRRALDDAHVEKDAVDGLFIKFPTSAIEFTYGQKVAEAAGMQPRIGGVWDQGGAANIGMIMYAAMAIEAGQCEIAVVSFADNPKTGSRGGIAKAMGPDEVFGWFGAAAGYAMIARRHMQQWGTTRDQLGAVAINARTNALTNPNAQLRKELTLDEYRESRPIVSPLTRDDCCLVSDGGAAVVLMSAARARKLRIAAPVPILGFGQGQTSWNVEQRPDLTSTMAKVSARSAFAMAGLRPADIDVAQFYDCFTIVPIMTLEDYGFAGPGQGGAFMAGAGAGIDSALPMNTSGGLLAETGMPGMQLIIEGVRQMRGTAALQVKRARNCIVSNQGGIMHTHATLILGAVA
jgi:acetyl-CoA acetyltransferase